MVRVGKVGGGFQRQRLCVVGRNGQGDVQVLDPPGPAALLIGQRDRAFDDLQRHADAGRRLLARNQVLGQQILDIAAVAAQHDVELGFLQAEFAGRRQATEDFGERLGAAKPLGFEHGVVLGVVDDDAVGDNRLQPAERRGADAQPAVEIGRCSLKGPIDQGRMSDNPRQEPKDPAEHHQPHEQPPPAAASGGKSRLGEFPVRLGDVPEWVSPSTGSNTCHSLPPRRFPGCEILVGSSGRRQTDLFVPRTPLGPSAIFIKGCRTKCYAIRPQPVRPRAKAYRTGSLGGQIGRYCQSVAVAGRSAPGGRLTGKGACIRLTTQFTQRHAVATRSSIHSENRPGYPHGMQERREPPGLQLQLRSLPAQGHMLRVSQLSSPGEATARLLFPRRRRAHLRSLVRTFRPAGCGEQGVEHTFTVQN